MLYFKWIYRITNFVDHFSRNTVTVILEWMTKVRRLYYCKLGISSASWTNRVEPVSEKFFSGIVPSKRRAAW